MIDRLEYGLDEDGIRINVPASAYDAAHSRAEYFAQIIDQPLAKRFVETDPREGGVSVLLNTARLGRIGDRWVRDERARAMTYVATMAALYTDLPDHDPDVPSVWMSLDPIGDGSQYGMDATVNRWLAPSHEVEAAVTQAMGRTALQLKHTSGRNVKGMVYSQVDHATGVTLETNPIASSSLDTDGMDYSPDETSVMLYGHNVYDRQTQLILLSGVIALAKA